MLASGKLRGYVSPARLLKISLVLRLAYVAVGLVGNPEFAEFDEVSRLSTVVVCSSWPIVVERTTHSKHPLNFPCLVFPQLLLFFQLVDFSLSIVVALRVGPLRNKMNGCTVCVSFIQSTRFCATLIVRLNDACSLVGGALVQERNYCTCDERDGQCTQEHSQLLNAGKVSVLCDKLVQAG